MAKLWFGSSTLPYQEDDSPYYEAKDLPWAVILEQNWPAIKTEALHFVEEQDKSFVSGSRFFSQAYKSKEGKVFEQGKWTNLQFFYWGMKLESGLEKCPELKKLIMQIPGIVSAGFSRLAPNSDIPPHHGDTNAIYRCHLAVEIPAVLPDCGFSVSNVERSWEEGKCLVFNDACLHKAWNHTNKRRIIIVLDIIRPEFIHRKNFICAFVLARYVSFYYNRSKFMQSMPVTIKTILFAFAFIGVYTLKPVYNLLKK